MPTVTLFNANAKIRDLLHYDAESGRLFWKQSGKGRGRKNGEAGTRQDRYMFVYVCGKRFSFHRLAWFLATGDWPKHCIDHINGNRYDNRLSNLRDVPHCVNMQNQTHARKDNSHGWLGVRNTSSGKWRACLRVGGKHIYGISRFDAETAHADYIKLKQLHHIGPYLCRQ